MSFSHTQPQAQPAQPHPSTTIQNFPWDSNLKDAASIANAATTSRSPTSSRQHRGRGQFGRRGFRSMRDGAAPHGGFRWWSWCVVFCKGGGLTRIKKWRGPEKCDKSENSVISVKLWFLLGWENVQKKMLVFQGDEADVSWKLLNINDVWRGISPRQPLCWVSFEVWKKLWNVFDDSWWTGNSCMVEDLPKLEMKLDVHQKFSWPEWFPMVICNIKTISIKDLFRYHLRFACLVVGKKSQIYSH